MGMKSLMARLVAAGRMVFPGWGGGGVYGQYGELLPLLPGSNRDWAAEAGDPWKNSAVNNALQFVTTTFPEARLRVMRRKRDGSEEEVVGHQLTRLLARPNSAYSGSVLWSALLLDYYCSGNAYLIKARGAGGRGQVLELWWAPSWTIRPVWPEDGSEFLSGYAYTPNGKPMALRVEDVVHLRCGLDPHNPRLGLSPLRAVLREIAGDNEASTYTASILRNMGVVGLVISPKGEATIQEPQRKLLAEEAKTRFTGDGRGGVLVAGGSVEVATLGWRPAEMDLGALRSINEERIAGAFGLPPIVVSFGAGLSRATYSNYKEAREQAYEQCLIPTQRTLAEQLDLQLLPDLGDPNREHCTWDYSEVRVLQEDQDRLHTRLQGDFKEGLIMRSEARTILGYEVVPERDDVFATGAKPAPEKVQKPAEEPDDDSEGEKSLPFRPTASMAR